MEQKIIAVVAGREIKESDLKIPAECTERAAGVSFQSTVQTAVSGSVCSTSYVCGARRGDEAGRDRRISGDGRKCQERYPCTDDNARSDERCSCDRRGCQNYYEEHKQQFTKERLFAQNIF